MFPPVPISWRVRSDTCMQLRTAVGGQADVRMTDQTRERMAEDGRFRQFAVAMARRSPKEQLRDASDDPRTLVYVSGVETVGE